MIKCGDCNTLIDIWGCCDCYDRMEDKEITPIQEEEPDDE